MVATSATRPHRTAPLLAAGLVAALPCRGADESITKRPIDGGPLLFVAVPSDARDAPRAAADGAWRHLLCAPEASPELVEWLTGPRALAPRLRLARDRFVLDADDGSPRHWLADLGAGTLTPLPIAPTETLADAHGDALFVLRGDGAATPLALWELPLAGGAARTIAPLPERAVASFVRIRCSPDGRRVAWSCAARWVAGEEAMAHLEPLAEPLFAVVDRASGATLHSRTVDSIAVSPLSSQLPALEFAWLDDATVRLSESRFEGDDADARLFPQQLFVDVAVADGRVVARHRRGAVGLGHEPPELELGDPALPRRIGHFEDDGLHLFFAGHPEPIAARRGLPQIVASDWRIAPGGAHALLLRERGGATERYLLTGATRERRLLLAGPPGRHGWLPAAR